MKIYEETRHKYIEDIWHPRVQPFMFYPYSLELECEMVTVQGSYFGLFTVTKSFIHF